MGSGSRIKYGTTGSLGLGFCLSRFPFALTLQFNVACFYLELGFGKGYDQ